MNKIYNKNADTLNQALIQKFITMFMKAVLTH